MVAASGIAPDSPRLQRGATLSQLYSPMVPPRGNAPRSIGYRPMALLLSYGGENGTSTWIRTKTFRLNRAMDYCYPTLVLLPTGIAPALIRLEYGCL